MGVREAGSTLVVWDVSAEMSIESGHPYIHPRAHTGRVAQGVVIQTDIALRRHQRRIRVVEVEIPETRLGRIAALDHPGHAVGAWH
jgi:hypothetical protein